MGRALVALVVLLALAAPSRAISDRHRTSAERVTYRYSLEQAGVPEEVVGGLTSETRGAGAVTVAHVLRVGPLGYADQLATVVAGATFVHVDHAGGRTLRLTLRPLGGTLSVFADGSRLLELDVAVLRSNDRTCRRRAEGELALEDIPSGVDIAYLKVCGTHHEHYYLDRVRGLVRVTIR